MNVDVKSHIQVVAFPATTFKRAGLIKLCDFDLMTLAQMNPESVKVYPNLYSFQNALNLDLVDTENYWLFFIDL
jgi:hypothetical protein